MRGAWVGIGLILSLCIVLPVIADDAYISTASIFELGVSARTIGLGGAFIALADDEAAVFYNPAGLPNLSQARLSSLYTRPFGAYSYGALGMAEQNWGGYLLILDSDILEERDLYGNPIGTFRYTSSGLLFGQGHRVNSNLSIGGQLKAYGLLSPTQGFGFSLTPCVLYRQGPFVTGVVWRNLLSTGTTYDDGHTEPWMRDIAVGISWQRKDISFCIDFTENLITRGDISCVRMGYEYTGFHPLVIRAGINRDWRSVGFSVCWKDLGVDFAYVLHRSLPGSYIVSLSYDNTGSFSAMLSEAIDSLGEALKQAF